MPIYEFVCSSCGHEFEKIVSFSSTHAPGCPSCAGDQVTRRLSPPAIHFKGSGWYITDSKKSSSSNGTNGTTETESKSGEKGEKTSKGESSGESQASSTGGSGEKSESSKSTKVDA